MKCESITTPNGLAAIVCSSGRRTTKCGACKSASRFQCDWKIAKGKTCDAHLCPTHAKQVAADKHLCPTHQSSYAEWLRSREIR